MPSREPLPQPEDWTEPGAYAVADGVHRIPLPLPNDGLTAVNVYVLEADDGLVLIDGGWALEVSERLLETSLRSIGHRLQDIRRFLVTHLHRDHYTQAIALRERVGAHVSLGYPERHSLAAVRDAKDRGGTTFDGLTQAGGADWLPRMRSGADDPFEDWHYADPDAWIDGEQRMELGAHVLDAVPTPGHTQGHVVFADTAREVLYAGDHVLPTITPSIGFEPVRTDFALHTYLDSLARVRALPDLMLFPAHGPVTGSTHTRVDELVEHHRVRLADSLAALDPGGSTPAQAATRLLWTRRNRRFEELTGYNAVLAILETMVHLELLAQRGEAVREERDGVRWYRRSRPPR